MNRRQYIKLTSIAGMSSLILPHAMAKRVMFPRGDEIVLPELEYAYNALEPYIDAKTMEIHHSKHHAGYTAKFKKAIEENELTGKSIAEIFTNISSYPDSVRNNGGGYFNHKLFWEVMSPNGGGKPKGSLSKDIERDFGSFENFRAEFSNAAATQFGSGWAWLIITPSNKLKVVSSPNQDNPLMDIAAVKGNPILCLDVWEHAYYLKYQNKRKEYIDNFWNVVNWEMIELWYKEDIR